MIFSNKEDIYSVMVTGDFIKILKNRVPVQAQQANQVLAFMQTFKEGTHSAIIGKVQDKPADRVILSTLFGGGRIVDMLMGEQ